MPATLSDTAVALLGDLPPMLEGAYDVQGVIDALAREIDRIDAAIDAVRANFYPQTGEDYLKVWESLLGLAVEPPDKTLEQRRASVLAFLQSLKMGGTGLAWEDALTRLIGTTWEYEEHDPADGTSPDPHALRITIPFGSPLAVPTGVTTSTATTGGTLAAGTYYYVVTALNSYGETTKSAQVSRATTGSTSTVTVSWDAVTGATGYRVYRGTVSGTHRLLTNVVGGDTLSYIDTGTATGTEQPPTVNSTSSPMAREAEALARQITPAHLDLQFGYGIGFVVGISEVGEEFL